VHLNTVGDCELKPNLYFFCMLLIGWIILSLSGGPSFFLSRSPYGRIYAVIILFVWYLMNIMVSLVNTSITHTVLSMQVSKDIWTFWKYSGVFIFSILFSFHICFCSLKK